jgi:hypothetical protein
MACKLCNDTGLVSVNETVSQVCPNGCNERLQAEYDQLFRVAHPEMSEEQIVNTRLGLASTGQSQVFRERLTMSSSADDGILSQT